MDNSKNKQSADMLDKLPPKLRNLIRDSGDEALEQIKKELLEEITPNSGKDRKSKNKKNEV